MSDHLRLLHWVDQESGIHLCAHPRFDIISQGRTRDEAYHSFLSALMMTVLYSVDDDGNVKPLALTPPDVAAKWAAAAQRQSPATKDDR